MASECCRCLDHLNAFEASCWPMALVKIITIYGIDIQRHGLIKNWCCSGQNLGVSLPKGNFTRLKALHIERATDFKSNLAAKGVGRII